MPLLEEETKRMMIYLDKESKKYQYEKDRLNKLILSCEDKIKEQYGVSTRNMPFDQTPIGDTCVCCGKKADKLIYFAKAY